MRRLLILACGLLFLPAVAGATPVTLVFTGVVHLASGPVSSVSEGDPITVTVNYDRLSPIFVGLDRSQIGYTATGLIDFALPGVTCTSQAPVSILVGVFNNPFLHRMGFEAPLDSASPDQTFLSVQGRQESESSTGPVFSDPIALLSPSEFAKFPIFTASLGPELIGYPLVRTQFTADLQLVSIPEPASAALVAFGLTGMMSLRTRCQEGGAEL